MGKSIEIGEATPVGNKGYITSLDTDTIHTQDIHKIYEIEQDMWSHGLGSYISCSDCNEISSKQDVFGYLEKNILTHTVARIEELLGKGIPCCPKCRSDDTSHVFDEQYRDEDIVHRYKFNESFLTVYKDTSGEIRGFVNAYISDFDTIYKKEFEPFYDKKIRDITFEKTIKLLGGNMPEKILSLNNMGAEQGHVSMTLLYYLLRSICQNISENYGEIDGIYDSILNNYVYGIHHVIGGKRLYVNKNLNSNTLNNNYKTDITVHPNAIKSTLNQLGSSARTFFREHTHTIKNIVNV